MWSLLQETDRLQGFDLSSSSVPPFESFLILWSDRNAKWNKSQGFIQNKFSSSFRARATALRKSLTRVRAASSRLSRFFRDGLA